MRPYLTFMSHRPGCSCCVSIDGHGYIRGNHSNETKRRIRRTAKRAVRQALKKECRNVD